MAGGQGWYVSLGLSLVGIVGALGGSALQHYLTLDRERGKVIEERQREAFVGFLNALDKSRVARMLEAKGEKKKALELETEFEVQGGAAFRRIAIYGDKDVVKAIAEWSRQSTRLGPCAGHWKSDLEVWLLMRKGSLGAGQDVSPRDLGELALFCRPPDTQ